MAKSALKFALKNKKNTTAHMILQNRSRRKKYRMPLQKLPHTAQKITAHLPFTIYYPTPPKKLPYTRLKLSPDEIAKVHLGEFRIRGFSRVVFKKYIKWKFRDCKSYRYVDNNNKPF